MGSGRKVFVTTSLKGTAAMHNSKNALMLTKRFPSVKPEDVMLGKALMEQIKRSDPKLVGEILVGQ